MTMVAVATPRPRASYTTFPRTGPQRSYSQESTHASPGTSPWYACGAKTTVTPEPNCHNPPSPVVAVHHERRDGPSRSERQQKESTRQQRQSPRSPISQQRSQPYPTMIECAHGQDPGHAPFDEPTFNDLGLQEMSLEDTLNLSLEDTFGFADNSKNDDVFERLYTGNDDEDGTFQSSIELNPYSDSAKDVRAELGKAKQTQEHIDIVQSTQSRAANKPTQRGRDSIFRSQSCRPSPIPPPPEKAQLLSPTAAMERRRTSSRARAAAPPSSVASPSPSYFTSASPLPGPVRRAGAGKSILRNNAGASRTSVRCANAGTPSKSRRRSASRDHRSCSRTSNRRRSRSRSTSIAPPKSEDDYHHNLFRGAKMIREQLLRSMSIADQAMDEAEREFMEEMIERGGGERLGGRKQQLQIARRRMAERNDGFEDGDIDFDYSFDVGKEGEAMAGIEPSPSRDSPALESESRRLDNLMSIFGVTSSTSSSNPSGIDVKRTPSDKENGLPGASTKVDEADAPRVITPTSSMSLSQLSSPKFVSPTPMQNTRAHNEYASRYFKEDAPKPMIASMGPSAGSILTVKNSIAKNDQAQKEHSHQKYEAIKEELRPQQRPPEGVDEALAHAQRAGPLWRSLVGNHVRFPSQWDSLLPSTTPPVHDIGRKWSKWFYVARHRVKGDKRLNSREFGVRSRRSGGRILMRLVVRETHSQQVCREIAIGCFHPNSKGIRKGGPVPEAEDVREVWMAVRWLMEEDSEEPTLDLRREGDEYEGVIDTFLMQRKATLEYDSMGSALGHRKAVNNENVRAVSMHVSKKLTSLHNFNISLNAPVLYNTNKMQIFGDQPPMTTLDLHEDEVAEILKANGRKKLAVLPALLLLKLFLFSK